MKILLANKFLYPKGGAETYLFALEKLLVENGHEVIYFSQTNPKNIKCGQAKYFVPDLELSRFSFKSLIRSGRIFWSFKAAKNFKKLLEDEKPDIVHLHNIYHQLSPSIIKAAKRAGLPVVMTVHDFKLIAPGYTLYADGKKHWHKNSLATHFLLSLESAFHRLIKIYQQVDLFIAPSQFVKERLVAKGISSDKITVIPHFVKPADLNNFFVQPADSNYLFAFGRLDESKGFDNLIRAFSELKNDSIRLVIAGTGPQEKLLKNLVEKLNLKERVDFVGYKNKSELRSLIEKAKFVISPSLVHETFGLGVLESFNCNRTVVAAKVGALPELVRNGINGLLFEINNTKDLTEKMESLIQNESLLNKLTLEAATTGHSALYSPQAHYQKIIKAYELAKQKHQALLNKKIKLIAPALKSAIILSIILSAVFLWAHFQNNWGKAITIPQNDYPLTAAFYLKTPLTDSDLQELAKWDLAILNMDAQNTPDKLKRLKELNPKIILLAYTSAAETMNSQLNVTEPNGSGLWHDLNKGLDQAWITKTYDGRPIHFWSDNNFMNHYAANWRGQRYGDYLADFLYDRLLSSGNWDGLFFDTTWQNINWLSQDMDLNNDGRKESAAQINQMWQTGNQYFYRQMREKIGNRYLIVTNGDGELSDFANGRMFEGFPEYWEGGWIGQMKKYLAIFDQNFSPRLAIMNSDTENTGNRYDYQSMRFGLTSALMSDGYYNFEYGTQGRTSLWWYDEYSVNLGQPLAKAVNLLDRQNPTIKTGVWQRDFERGIALVNSTDKVQTIELDGEYEKIHGTEDRVTNDGSIVNRVTLAASDGLILLRPSSEILGATYINGSFARIFKAGGQTAKTGFFTYDKNYPGSAKILKYDLNRDGEPEIIVAGKNSVSLYKNPLVPEKTIQPYGDRYNGGFSIAIADFDGQGYYSIIIAPERGGANLVKIYDMWLNDTDQSFTAYNSAAKNLGATVAACDINNDGTPEIITGAGFYGGPYIRIYTKDGELQSGWYAFEKNFRGGVNVACGDVDSDGQVEIVAGAGLTGGPYIKVFSGNKQMKSGWYAFDKNKRQGVSVAVSDINGDNILEIIALNSYVFMANGK